MLPIDIAQNMSNHSDNIKINSLEKSNINFLGVNQVTGVYSALHTT